MGENSFSPHVSFGKVRCKDTKFPIKRNCSLKKLYETYFKSFDEFIKGFPKDFPLQYLFILHDEFFDAHYLKMDKNGRLVWKP